MDLKNFIKDRKSDSIRESYNYSNYNIDNSNVRFQNDIEEIKRTVYEARHNKNEKFFFNNIIFFTNERDSKKNKTLKNLEDAIKGTKIKLIIFVAEEVEYKADDNRIEIHDKVTNYVIDKQSNIDTIAIVRLGAQDSEECMECIKEIQDWGIFTLNPIMAAKRASNKYSSSVLMSRYDIPQPRFTLINKMDIEGKDPKKMLNEKLADIYPEIKKAKSDKDTDDLEYVVKILNGHGGTGVFMVNGKGILSILQAIFAIDEERELLIQKKEEADGGDIRVHVLTRRTDQKIIAAMKRVKLKGDFRSNVSLGATAESVKLTKEQEKIALKVAKISGMPWCAVDIMPLKKGSNKEIGDNVVLEYNASPGTDGISEVIKENFCSLLLDAINDINELVLAPKSIGYKEDITVTINNTNFKFEAKLDTGNGAKASTIGCDSIEDKGKKIIAVIDGKRFTFDKYGVSKAKVGPIVEERNTVIIDCIQIGTRKLLDVEFALVDNRDKSTKVLLNRDVLSKMAYMIDPGRKHTIDNIPRNK
ncbi:MAG: hypothetical protein J6D03_10610 [Clostridia bacterium]|nr:hypothetical protein [Clostridia bacterium]